MVAENFKYEWRLGQDIDADDDTEIDDITRDKYIHVNSINEQDEVPLLPMIVNDEIEEEEGEIDLQPEEVVESVCEDIFIIDEVYTHMHDVE